MTTQKVPPHLNQANWLEYEESSALALFDALADELEKIAKKPNAKRVHDTRVALRRWHSIWEVLEHDGWSTKSYWKKVGRHLKKLQKALGKLRDWDVNLEIADDYSLPRKVFADWSVERTKNAHKLHSRLKKIDMDGLLKDMRKFLKNRADKIRADLETHHARELEETAFIHLEPFLHEQEEFVRKIERAAVSPEALHELRLSIKAWRYLLTEFFGLTNLQLVRCQQLLGKYNDLIRCLTLLRENDDHAELAKDAILKLESQSEQLLKEFSQFRKALPYGLRPYILSLENRQ